MQKSDQQTLPSQKNIQKRIGRRKARREELNGKKKEKWKKEEKFLRQKEEGKGREGKEYIR
jgi:hypothetical protein